MTSPFTRADPTLQPQTVDIDELDHDEEMQKFMREKLRNRLWGETWVGEFMLGFLGATDDGVFFVIFTHLTLYLVLSLGWLFLLEIDSINQEVTTTNFTGAFNPITFVIALIFRDIVQTAADKTTGTSKLYVQLQSEILHFATLMGAIKSSILRTPSGKEFSKLGDHAENEETREVALSHVKEIRGYCMVMAKYSYRLFTGVDEARDYVVFDFDDFEVRAEYALGKVRMYGDNATLIMTGAITKLTDELVHMSERKIVSSGVYSDASGCLETINKTTNQIWASQHINSPEIFGKIYDIILKFYLYIMIPLQVISATNRFWALLIYPLVLVVYTVPIILGDWLRSPFSPNSRWDGPPLLAFRNVLYRRIEHRIGNPDERSARKPGTTFYRQLNRDKGVSTIIEL